MIKNLRKSDTNLHFFIIVYRAPVHSQTTQVSENQIFIHEVF